MSTEIRVPTLGESVTEATIGQWYKKVGDAVAAGMARAAESIDSGAAAQVLQRWIDVAKQAQAAA